MWLILTGWLSSFARSATAGAALTSLGGLPATGGQLGGNLDANSNKLTNLANGSSSGDSVNYGQVIALTNNLDWKNSCRAATTTDLPACTYANGSSGVGATLTGDANGALSAQDGVTLIANDRILVKNQTDAEENGIYIVSVVGNGGAAFVLTRATDADTAAELSPGASVTIEEGTSNGTLGYRLTTTGAITIGTTDLTFTMIPGVALGSSTPAALSSSGSAGSASVASKEDHVHATTGLVVAAGTGLTGQIVTLGQKYSGNMASGTATLVVNKDVNFLDCGGANGVFTMPAAAGDGSVVILKRYDTSGDGSNSCTVSRASSDTVETDAGADGTSITLPNRSSVRYVSPIGVSGKWVIIA